ncbi:hypothetical protein ACWGJ2_32045 [Streptomyces sp. NPDC054796]
MVTESHASATQVSVQLSGCDTQDAQAVFTVLHSLFPSERESEGPHRAEGGARPDVWLSDFDVAGGGGRPDRPALKGTVAAELQGAPQAVGLLERALADAFTVHEENSAAGDQEQQRWLRLESR